MNSQDVGMYALVNGTGMNKWKALKKRRKGTGKKGMGGRAKRNQAGLSGQRLRRRGEMDAAEKSGTRGQRVHLQLGWTREPASLGKLEIRRRQAILGQRRSLTACAVRTKAVEMTHFGHEMTNLTGQA